jgi:hypothetical protein
MKYGCKAKAKAKALLARARECPLGASALGASAPLALANLR